MKSGSYGSTAVTHFDNNQGHWCINHEQPRNEQCADFEVRFCCPDEFRNPCAFANLTCAENSHAVYMTKNETYSQCLCSCDEGFIDVNGTCVEDTHCKPSKDECVDFDQCFNKGGSVKVLFSIFFIQFRQYRYKEVNEKLRPAGELYAQEMNSTVVLTAPLVPTELTVTTKTRTETDSLSSATQDRL